MFNKNDFISWTNKSIDTNPEAKEWRNRINNPMKQINQPSQQLPEESEEGELNELLGTAMVIGAGLGGAAHLYKKGRERQKRSIERRAQNSKMQSQGGMPSSDGKVQRTWHGGEVRKLHKDREAGKIQPQQTDEGIIGGIVKTGLAAGAAYGGYKAYKGWKAKQATVNAQSAEDTPSTPPASKTRQLMGTVAAQAKEKVVNRVRTDPQSSGIMKAAQGAGKSIARSPAYKGVKRSLGNSALRLGNVVQKDGGKVSGAISGGLKAAGSFLKKGTK